MQDDVSEMEHRDGLIVLSSAARGGIADYLHFQANALVRSGVDVTMVGPIGTDRRDDAQYSYVQLWMEPQTTRSRWRRKVSFVQSLLQNTRRFARFLEQRPERNVLFGSYFEYASPLWAWRYRRLAARGWNIATIIHDPVRDFVVGPRWWHQWSIREAYSFVKTGFVHGNPLAVESPGKVKVVSVPMGPYPFPAANQAREQVRTAWNVGRDQLVILAFGNIRDGKNLDLLIQAIAQQSNVHLVVAGREQSSAQKPASFYQELARRLGISDRCHFEIRHIAEAEVGGIFEAADLLALTYSRSFRSASSALAACSNYRKPCLASSGDGPLHDLIRQYKLGVWVEPDSIEAIQQGIAEYLTDAPIAEWDRYERENSWQSNADIVIGAMGLNATLEADHVCV